MSGNGGAPHRDHLSDHPVSRGQTGSAPDKAIQRRALRLEEAAESLGVSLDFFREHIAPDLKVIRKSRVRLIPVSELDRWLDEMACALPSSLQ
jgi:hypothetical protein